jgi:dGTPase
MGKSIKERTYELEEVIFSPNAFFSKDTKGRANPDEECNIRTPFQVDRDRIIHSQSFRRLKHKTQVFLSPKGDYYRTRLTHTLEVSQIARTIAMALRLNENLTEAIALGHDLGHTPFGHAGERALDKICPLGFKHYEHSVRVVEKLEKHGRGLNLTYEVKDGIMRHTNGPLPKTLEGQIVRIADKVAYINHDIEDAKRAGILRDEDIPKEAMLYIGDTHAKRINKLVTSIIENSTDKLIKMDEETDTYFNLLHRFMYDTVYINSKAKDQEGKAMEMIAMLYDYFKKSLDELPATCKAILENEGEDRAVCDYIAGMTDKYAIEKFKDVFVPKEWEED